MPGRRSRARRGGREGRGRCGKKRDQHQHPQRRGRSGGRGGRSGRRGAPNPSMCRIGDGGWRPCPRPSVLARPKVPRVSPPLSARLVRFSSPFQLRCACTGVECGDRGSGTPENVDEARRRARWWRMASGTPAAHSLGLVPDGCIVAGARGGCHGPRPPQRRRDVSAWRSERLNGCACLRGHRASPIRVPPEHLFVATSAPPRGSLTLTLQARSSGPCVQPSA